MRTAGIFNFGSAATPNHAKRDKAALSQGAHMVAELCREQWMDVLDLCDRWAPVDILLVSLYWWEHAYDLVNLLASRGIEYRRSKRAERPIVFIGGQLPSYNPSVLREIVDLACIGDGEEAGPRALRILLDGGSARDCWGIPGVYVSAVDAQVEWQQVADISSTLRFPFVNHAAFIAPSGVRVETSWERRIEIARGCRHKCLYCGVGWTKRYRENPAEDVIGQMRVTDGNVKTFAPDPLAHSGADAIVEEFVSSGRGMQFRDISTRSILAGGFRGMHSVSVGVDGLSERIRRALCKPLSDADLVEVIKRANEHMGQMGTYQILGLPGETPEDVSAWFKALRRASDLLEPLRQVSEENKRRGFTAEKFHVLVTLNAFCPTPHTPLQWAGIDWRARLTDRYMAQIDILGPKEDRPLKHKLLGRAHGPVSRLLESAVLRGAPELSELVIALAPLRSRLLGFRAVDRVLLAAKRLGLDERLLWTVGEKADNEPFPWEARVKPLFPRPALLAGWRKYRRAIGLPTGKLSP